MLRVVGFLKIEKYIAQKKISTHLKNSRVLKSFSKIIIYTQNIST